MQTTLFFGLLFPTAGCATNSRHPFLAFNEADVPALRERAKEAPYRYWMAAVNQNAECGVKFSPGESNPQCPANSPAPPGLSCPWSSGATNESCQSGYAFNLALANTIAPNDAYVQQIVKLLKNAGKYEANWNSSPAGGWYWGADLQAYAYAYDMVAPYLTSEDQKAIVNVLNGMLNRTMISYLDPLNTAYVTNVRLRVGAGAGTLAIALDRQVLSSLWADTIERNLFGDNRVSPGLVSEYVSTVVTPEGTMTEGPSYQNDAFAIMLPYLYVLKDHFGRDYINGINTLPQWTGDNRIAKMYERNALLSMPDKNSATVTTGWRMGFTLGNLAAPRLPTPNNEELKWFFRWQEGSGPINQSVPGLSFLYANASLSTSPPAAMSQVTPDWTSFRSSWDDNALYFLMQSEYWPEPSTHGQPDQTSFILYAKDRYLLIDPGDGRNYCTNMSAGCTQHSQINHSPEAHNLVIVDGLRGCDKNQQTPARLIGDYRRTRDAVSVLAGFVSPIASSSMISLPTYFSAPDVSTYRTAMMARGRYMAVFDGMVSGKGKDHTYDALLHFGGPVTNQDSTCLAAQTGASETCGSNEANQFCWNKPSVGEFTHSAPNSLLSNGDEGLQGPPSSCIKANSNSLPSGVIDCGTVVGTLDLGTSGSDRLSWSTKSNKGQPIELSAVFAPAPVSFTQDTFPTNFYSNAVFTHPFVRARYSGATTQWVNVLYPRETANKEPVPSITTLPIGSGNGAALAIKVDADGIDDVAIVSDALGALKVGNDVSFNGRAALLLRNAGETVQANLHDASSFVYKNVEVFSAKPSAHAMLSWNAGNLTAEVVEQNTTRICLQYAPPVATLFVDGAAIQTVRDGATLCATIPAGKHVISAQK